MRHRVSVIGMGEVGQAVARRLAARDHAEIVLCDPHSGAAEALALDLNQSAALAGYEPCVAISAGFEEIGGSELIVLTAGGPGVDGDPTEPDARFTGNADRLRDSLGAIAQRAPDAVVLVVAEPSDAIAQLALARTGFPRGRIVGVAGSLAASALRARLAHELRISVRDVSALVLGGPAERMIVPIARLSAGGVAVTELLGEAAVREAVGWARERGVAPPEATAAAATELVEAVLLDQRRLLCAAVQCQGEFGVDGLVAGVPVKLGRGGVQEIVEVALEDAERDALHASCAAARAMVSEYEPRSSPAGP